MNWKIVTIGTQRYKDRTQMLEQTFEFREKMRWMAERRLHQTTLSYGKQIPVQFDMYEIGHL